MLTAVTAARRLGVRRHTFYAYAAAGTIVPAVRVNARVMYYAEADVMRLLDNRNPTVAAARPRRPTNWGATKTCGRCRGSPAGRSASHPSLCRGCINAQWRVLNYARGYCAGELGSSHLCPGHEDRMSLYEERASLGLSIFDGLSAADAHEEAD